MDEKTELDKTLEAVLFIPLWVAPKFIKITQMLRTSLILGVAMENNSGFGFLRPTELNILLINKVDSQNKNSDSCLFSNIRLWEKLFLGPMATRGAPVISGFGHHI